VGRRLFTDDDVEDDMEASQKRSRSRFNAPQSVRFHMQSFLSVKL
jgi:hypothetical protein